MKSNEFEQQLSRHKMTLSNMEVMGNKYKLIPQDKLQKTITVIKKTGEELALVASNFRCNGCGCMADLQFHHLIGRENKKILSFVEYVMKRHYYGNIVILCDNCHKDFHGHNGKRYTISDEKVEKIKYKYKHHG